MRRFYWLVGLILPIGVLLPSGAWGAIRLGQIDDFQTGSTLGWQHGFNSMAQPSLVSFGGPLGAGDQYLQNFSTGDSGADSKQIMFNLDQWTGNYEATGVTRITAQMADFGPSPLFMRVTIQDNFGTDYGSTDAILLPPDGTWHAVSFDLNASGMTLIQGSSTLSDALSNVGVLRILSAANGPSFLGDTTPATLGVDDIAAVPEPVLLAAPLMAAMLRRRRRVSYGSC